MNWADWFRKQLSTSGESFEWALNAIQPEHYRELPPNPKYLGKWSPLRHVWHVEQYERVIAFPSMRMFLDEEGPVRGAFDDDDNAWSVCSTLTSAKLLAQFHATREQQIKLLDRFVEFNWDNPRDTNWGEKPLSFVVTKTFQHTYEHGDTLLRMGLWWEEERELELLREERKIKQLAKKST